MERRTEKRSIPVPQQIYRHFKGNHYQIVTVAEHTETGEQMVVYQALYGGYKIYVRPLEMFMEPVDTVKYPEVKQYYRFELIGCPMQEKEPVQMCGPEEVMQEEPKNGLQEKPEEEVLQFLDAKTYTEKLKILSSVHERITDRMITIMAIASDIEVNDGDLETRYESLKSCLQTLEKYECSRLR